jgi:hypothetical protein
MMSTDIERRIVVNASRTMRAAQIAAFHRQIQVDEAPVAAPRF